ncbi:MAG: hypothetical protein AAFZ07_16675 [Actinomycetota bacterium]
MTSLLDPSPVSAVETRNERAVYTGIAVVVALAMFVAASGSGSGEYVTAEPPPDALNVAGNVFAAIVGILVLVPKSRGIGALLAVANMFVSMYLNYTYDGVDYFVDLIAYNTVTIMLGSILIGHHARDLTRWIPRRTSEPDQRDGDRDGGTPAEPAGDTEPARSSS